MAKVISTDRDRDMILHPLKWPHTVLPLKRVDDFQFDLAVFNPPLGRTEISETEPITVGLYNMFTVGGPSKTYENVDALLADGWRVD